jgi:type IV pilus assembly protein PilA
MKKMNKKGFTLAELLIVVAIIAVLVAIAIPVFSAQLEKSRDATTAANLRSAYAEAVAAYISDDDSAANVEFKSDTEHNVVKVSGVELLDTDSDLKDAGADLPFSGFTLPGAKKTGGYDVTFTFNTTTGAITSVGIA